MAWLWGVGSMSTSQLPKQPLVSWLGTVLHNDELAPSQPSPDGSVAILSFFAAQLGDNG